MVQRYYIALLLLKHEKRTVKPLIESVGDIHPREPYAESDWLMQFNIVRRQSGGCQVGATDKAQGFPRKWNDQSTQETDSVSESQL